MNSPTKQAQKQRKKRAEVAEFKLRVEELEHLGVIVNAVFLQEGISSGRFTRKEVILDLLKWKQAVLDNWEKEKVFELPDKLREFVSAAEKCNKKGGPCTNLGVIRKAIGTVQELDFSKVTVEASDVDAGQVALKLKTSLDSAFKASNHLGKMIMAIETALNDTLSEENYNYAKADLIMDPKYFLEFPEKFTSSEIRFFKEDKLKNHVKIVLVLGGTVQKLSTQALISQLDNFEKDAGPMRALLTGANKKMQVLIELGGSKTKVHRNLTPAFNNGAKDFGQFSLVLKSGFVNYVMYNQTTDRQLKKFFPDLLEMTTQVNQWATVLLPIEKMNSGKPVDRLNSQLVMAEKELESSLALKPFHQCLKKLANIPSEKATLDSWTKEVDHMEKLGDSASAFVGAFNTKPLQYNRLKQFHKNHPSGDGKVFIEGVKSYGSIKEFLSELKTLHNDVKTGIDDKLAQWYRDTQIDKIKGPLPNDKVLASGMHCAQEKDKLKNAAAAVKSGDTFAAISEFTSANQYIAETNELVERVAKLDAEINKVNPASPAKQVKSTKSNLPFNQTQVQALAKGIKVPVDMVTAIEHEADFEKITAHYETLPPTKKKEFDPYYTAVKGTVEKAAKVSKEVITKYVRLRRDDLEEYQNEFKHDIDKAGLESFNGEECMNKLHEIGVPLKDKEAENRLRHVDLNFVRAETVMTAAGKLIPMFATYFLTVAPRSVPESIQKIMVEKKEEDEGPNWFMIGAITGASLFVGSIAITCAVSYYKYRRRQKKNEEDEFQKLKAWVVTDQNNPKVKTVAPSNQISKDEETVRDENYVDESGWIVVMRTEQPKRTATKITGAELGKMSKNHKAAFKHSSKVMTEQEKIIAIFQAPANEQVAFNQTPRTTKQIRKMAEKVYEDQYEERIQDPKITPCQLDRAVGRGLDTYVKPEGQITEASTRFNATIVPAQATESLRKRRNEVKLDITQEESARRAKKVEELLDKTQEFSERAHGGRDNKKNAAPKAASKNNKTYAEKRKPKMKKMTELAIHNTTPEKWLELCLYFDESTATPEEIAKGTNDQSEKWFPGAFENGEIDVFKIASGFTKEKFLTVEKFPITEGKNQCRYPLTAQQVIKIFKMAQTLHEADAAFLEIERKRTLIVGDIHGKIRDFYYHYNIAFDDDTMTMLCLGDYVDRGDRSLCCLLSTSIQKIIHPTKFYFLSGNHEIGNSSINYGFAGECIRIFGEVWGRKVYVAAMYMCKEMPVCALLQKRVFCAHGGIVQQMEQGIEKFKTMVKKHPETEEEAIIVLTIRWADGTEEHRFDPKQPADYQKGWRGQDAVNNFTALGLQNVSKACSLDLVVRAHEIVDGVRPFSGTRCFTLFSSTNMKKTNMAASMIYNSDNTVEIIRFVNVMDPPGVETPLTPHRPKPPPPAEVRQVDETKKNEQ